MDLLYFFFSVFIPIFIAVLAMTLGGFVAGTLNNYCPLFNPINKFFLSSKEKDLLENLLYKFKNGLDVTVQEYSYKYGWEVKFKSFDNSKFIVVTKDLLEINRTEGYELSLMFSNLFYYEVITYTKDKIYKALD